MKTIYFIDNESIKRTAKSIQKTNPTFKHTVILDDLAKLLGYTSYNQYEHYLTNAILSKDNSLKSLKALTKIDSIELLILKDKFIDKLASTGYSIDSLYFINKIIDNQRQGFIEHSHLNLKAYIYYLPFVFTPTNELLNVDATFIRHGQLQNIINIVIDEYKKIDVEAIENLIRRMKISPDYSVDSELYNAFSKFNDDLKTRGIYYYIKSIMEDFDYDEGYLTKLIFEGHSVEKIEHHINIRIEKQRLARNDEIPVFFKADKYTSLQNYYPFIRESVTEEKPFIFGRQVDQSPFFATPEHLHSNISVLGAPGTGKGVFIHSLMFQLMMNNRGFCVMNPLGRDYSTTYIKNMATLLNKKNDMFVFNTDASTKLISSSIHNDKIVYTTFDTRDDDRRNVDTLRLGSNRFEQILIALTEQFFTSKFRNKKIPFYIIIEEAHNLMNINENTSNMIKKLNELNIFFVFDHQLHEDYINDLCNTTLVTNSSFFLFKNAANFEFKQLMINLYDRKELIGTTGPTKKLPPVFSIIQKGVHTGQFITEIDEDLYDNIQQP
jgi:hypothetical protein